MFGCIRIVSQIKNYYFTTAPCFHSKKQILCRCRCWWHSLLDGVDDTPPKLNSQNPWKMEFAFPFQILSSFQGPIFVKLPARWAPTSCKWRLLGPYLPCRLPWTPCFCRYDGGAPKKHTPKHRSPPEVFAGKTRGFWPGDWAFFGRRKNDSSVKHHHQPPATTRHSHHPTLNKIKLRSKSAPPRAENREIPAHVISALQQLED